MIPRTYDALATLGQQHGMKGQADLIATSVAAEREITSVNRTGIRRTNTGSLPDALAHSAEIKTPDLQWLEKRLNVKVCTATLNVSAFSDGKWKYREIYIHSKLMLIDDVFITMGSANLNQRSMCVDTELNICTTAPALAKALRMKIFAALSGNSFDGGDATPAETSILFEKLSDLMNRNRQKMLNNSLSAEQRKMTGFLVPLEDKRSSTTRLG